MGIKGSPTSWSVSQSDVRTVGVTDTDRQADGQDLDGGFQREQRPSVTIEGMRVTSSSFLEVIQEHLLSGKKLLSRS